MLKMYVIGQSYVKSACISQMCCSLPARGSKALNYTCLDSFLFKSFLGSFNRWNVHVPKTMAIRKHPKTWKITNSFRQMEAEMDVSESKRRRRSKGESMMLWLCCCCYGSHFLFCSLIWCLCCMNGYVLPPKTHQLCRKPFSAPDVIRMWPYVDQTRLWMWIELSDLKAALNTSGVHLHFIQGCAHDIFQHKVKASFLSHTRWYSTRTLAFSLQMYYFFPVNHFLVTCIVAVCLKSFLCLKLPCFSASANLNFLHFHTCSVTGSDCLHSYSCIDAKWSH